MSDPGPDLSQEHAIRRVLRIRDVRLYMAQRFLAGAGMMLVRATIAWQVYEISGSALQLALIGGVQFVPTAFFSLIAGAAADTYDRRRLVILAQSAGLVGSAILFALTAAGQITLPAIYAVIFLNALASSFENPAGASILPSLVPREIFPNATALLSSVRNLAWVTGPAAVGFVIEAFGPEGAYALHAALLLLAIALMAAIRPRRVEGAASGVTWTAIREGVSFVRSRPAILGAMTLDMLAVIFGAAEALLPIFAKDILGVGPRGYGLLAAALPVGTFSMAVLLVAMPPMQRAGRALLLAVGAYSVATVSFGLSQFFWLSVVTYGAAGAADQISMVARSTIIQLSTPDALRGRVNSVNFVFIGASNHLGAVEAGVLAWLTSAPFSVVVGGLAALAVTVWMALRIPELRRYDIRDDH